MQVTINSRYALRNEKNCSFIIFAGDAGEVKDEKVPLLNPIPPFLGFLFSYCNNADLYDAIAKIETELKIPAHKANCFIQRCLNNTEPFISEINGIKICIPPLFLINSGSNAKITTETGAAFDDKFKVHRLNVPAYLNIMITSKCKTNCIYCYADRSRKDDMQLSEILNLIEQAHQYGVIGVNISGGDILAFEGWKNIVQRMCEFGYFPSISTKIPIDERDILFLKELNINKIQFSLDSIDAEIERKILKIDGENYLSKVFQTIALCQKHNLKLDIKTVVTCFNDNPQIIETMYNFLSRYDCINSWNLMPSFKSDFKSDFKVYKTKSENLLKIYEKITNFTPNFIIYTDNLKNKLSTSFKKYKTVTEFTDKNKLCNANNYSLTVLSNGMATFCEMLYYNEFFYIGDIKKQSIKDIWNAKKSLMFYNFVNPEYKNSESECYKCESLKKCKNSESKRFCVVDVIKSYGKDKWDYPDPRCPKAPKTDLEMIM
ncbi:MAG: radical SAM protein [Bacteroidales bacterium]|nr:radical SAM protein [Bacteroidales bacterium]